MSCRLTSASVLCPAGTRPGQRHQQRRTHRLLPQAVLLEAAVVPQAITVIAQIDDQRVLRQAELLERLEHPADVAVEELDRRVVRRRDALFLRVGQVAEDRRDLKSPSSAPTLGTANASGCCRPRNSTGK